MNITGNVSVSWRSVRGVEVAEVKGSELASIYRTAECEDRVPSGVSSLLISRG